MRIRNNQTIQISKDIEYLKHFLYIAKKLRFASQNLRYTLGGSVIFFEQILALMISCSFI